MSVSMESWTPLVHDAVAHTLFTQAALRQSAPWSHALPPAQRGQDPPQSVSVSVPFLIPSVQAGGGATHESPSATNPGLQSKPQSLPRHAAWPFATWGHGEQVESPQPFALEGSTQRPLHSFCESAHGGVVGLTLVQPGPFPSTHVVPPHDAPSQVVPPLLDVATPPAPPLAPLPKRRSCAPLSTDPHPALASRQTSMQANLRMHLRR
jgi:hypothetical protein